MIRLVSFLIFFVLHIIAFAENEDALSEHMRKYDVFSHSEDVISEFMGDNDALEINHDKKNDILHEKTPSNNDETFSHRLSKTDIPKKFKLKELTIGNNKAKIHLIIYSSFTCPHCREFHEHEFPIFKKKYIDSGKVKVSFRSYLDDQGAMEAAQIIRCLCNESTDIYMSLCNKIYGEQIAWLKSEDPQTFLKNIFTKLGFDIKQVNKCLARTDIAAGLMLEQKRAMHELGLLSMPAFLVNGNVHIGKIDCVKLVKLCGL